MNNGDNHTLVFTVTDREKFGVLWKELMPMNVTERQAATEKYGAYAICSSYGNLNEQLELKDKALEYYAERADNNVNDEVDDMLGEE